MAAGSTKIFVSESFHYSVQYPVGWYYAGIDQQFEIHSFPSEKAERGIVIPTSGADISITVPSQLVLNGLTSPATIEEFAQFHTRRQRIVAQKNLVIRDSARELSVTEVRTRCCGSKPLLYNVQWYFQIDGHLFNASLGYRDGDENAASFQHVLEQIVLSLKTLPTMQRSPDPAR